MKTAEQLEKILAMLDKNNTGIVELKTTMQEMITTKEKFDVWKPKVENTVAGLQNAVAILGSRMELLSTDKKPSFFGDPPMGFFFAPATPDLAATSKEAASGPKGHRVDNHNQGSEFGVVYAIPPPPAIIGAMNHLFPTLLVLVIQIVVARAFTAFCTHLYR